MKKKIIDFSREKFIIGCIIGGITFGICCLEYSPKAGIILAVFFVLLGAIKVNRDIGYVKIVWFLVSMMGICVVSQLIIQARQLWELEFIFIVFELISASCICLLIHIFFLDGRISVSIGTGLLLILSIIDYYVVQFRGNEFTPMDFFVMKTAINVAGEYNYNVIASLFYGVAVWGLIFFSGFIFNWQSTNKKAKNIQRLKCIILEFILVGVWFVGCSNVKITTWGQDGANYNGYFVNFSAQLIELWRDKRPNDYDVGVIEEYEKEYIEHKSNGADSPDIIVIMNESFADLDILGTELNTSESITTYLDSLDENVIKGYALTSVFGGGTANSEYEFLTGNTMGFITEGVTAYQLYLKNSSFSIASALKNKGYTCVATHPYYSTGWSRTRAWPYLGFDKITFIEDYPQKNLIRDYVSDQEMYEYITELYEEKEENESLFLFGVTMQNHGGYEYEGSGYTPKIVLDGYDENYSDVEQYLGLLNESDKALEYLINYFSGVENDVVILFFGDHLPNVNKNFFEEVHGEPLDTLEEQQLQYTVPFFVWTNYDIEEQNVELTSLNFLSNYVYQAAGIELPAYNQVLCDVEEYIPAMNAFGYYSLENDRFMEYEQAEGKEAELLNMYENLQYNSLFERENRSEVFFPTSE